MVQMAPVASFHLIREPRGPVGATRNLARLGTERAALARVPGVVLWRLLGTGRGANTARSVQPERRAVFLVWRDDADLQAFVDESALMKRWQGVEESWHVRLSGAGGHGTWKGVDVPGVLAGSGPDRARASVTPPGPVAVLTRAVVRTRAWRRFAAVGAPVSEQVAGAQGLLNVVGVGEAPVGRQATFSLWDSLDSVRAFAYGEGVHHEVVGRTHREGWYGEEMFARFVPTASTGRWDGVDPLSGRIPTWW